MEHIRNAEPATCLALHAAYRCRHAGACCTAGWSIPIEPAAYAHVSAHFADTPLGRSVPLFVDGGPPPPGAAAVVATRSNGACVFFEEDRGKLCAIHRELGESRLPVACQHFPRVVLHTPTMTRISLSHFCPTAAAMLQAPDRRAFDIVSAPSSLSLDGRVEGLDARETLPPLLAPGMLTDLEGYDAWERHALQMLADGSQPAVLVLDDLGAATLDLQSWRPGGATLNETVARIISTAAVRRDRHATGADAIHAPAAVALYDLAAGSVPSGLAAPMAPPDVSARWETIQPWWAEFDATVRAYLAARLFGNWIAYYGQGLHTVVAYLHVALAVLQVEAARHHAKESSSTPWQTVLAAIRSADLLLVHLADTRVLAHRLG